LNTKRKYFILGLVFLCIALFSVTFLPLIIQKYIKLGISEYMYAQIEFFFLFWCACLYAFSPKYYKYQLLSIFLVFLLYFVFIRFFRFVM